MAREPRDRRRTALRGLAVLAVLVAGVLIVRARPTAPPTPPPAEPTPELVITPPRPDLGPDCEAPEADPLFDFARQQWGAPSGCVRRMAHAEGTDWPTDTWAYRDGVTLTYQRSPPESFSAVLAAPGGFDAAAARELVARLAADWREGGFRIDVTGPPRVEVEGDRRRETWWDPEEGLNARIGIVTQGERVVEIRRSAAL